MHTYIYIYIYDFSIIASVAWDAANKIIVSLFQHSHMRKTLYEHDMTMWSKKLLKMQHERAHRDCVKFPGEETDDAIFFCVLGGRLSV